MKDQPKKQCCKGCENGTPGQNQACKAKLLIESLNKTRQEQVLETKK